MRSCLECSCGASIDSSGSPGFIEVGNRQFWEKHKDCYPGVKEGKPSEAVDSWINEWTQRNDS